MQTLPWRERTGSLPSKGKTFILGRSWGICGEGGLGQGAGMNVLRGAPGTKKDGHP